MDVGGFAEPRKILCLSVLTPPLSNYQYITGRRIPPYKWYQSLTPELAMMDESSECRTKSGGPPSKSRCNPWISSIG